MFATARSRLPSRSRSIKITERGPFPAGTVIDENWSSVVCEKSGVIECSNKMMMVFIKYLKNTSIVKCETVFQLPAGYEPHVSGFSTSPKANHGLSVRLLLIQIRFSF